MAHNFYSRGPEGLEVANRRALGSDDNAVAQGFTHFASTRSGPWKPLGVQGPGAPPGNQNARRKPELEILAEQFVAKVVSTRGAQSHLQSWQHFRRQTAACAWRPSMPWTLPTMRYKILGYPSTWSVWLPLLASRPKCSSDLRL